MARPSLTLTGGMLVKVPQLAELLAESVLRPPVLAPPQWEAQQPAGEARWLSEGWAGLQEALVPEQPQTRSVVSPLQIISSSRAQWLLIPSLVWQEARLEKDSQRR